MQTDLQIPSQKITLNCRGKLVSLEHPVVMGILNVTPDSFYADSRKSVPEEVLEHAGRMLNEGAVFIDIGGYSSRPGASDISEEEELARVIPAIVLIRKHYPDALISIDTFRSSVALAALEAGAHLVNDISAGDDDPRMIETVASYGAPYVAMHKRGNPQTMQQLANYEDVVLEVMNYFTHKVVQLQKAGVKDIILDPGFGFAKLPEHNYRLLNRLGDFKIFGLPVLAGLSRKGMIRHVTGTGLADALNGTTVLNTIALLKGAGILRVHDVKEAVECIKLVKALHGSV